MKIAIISDQHIGVKNDADEFYNYQMRFYNNVFLPYIEEHNIKTLINCGDFTDRRKYINYKTLSRFRNEYIYRLRDMGVTQHNIIGNHDTTYKNTNALNSMTELFSGVENFHIYSEATEVELGGRKMLFMPWICEDNHQRSMEAIEATEAKILFGHLELRGFEMYRGAVMHDGFDYKTFKKFDAVYSGHYHHKSDNYNIHYLGAPCEYTWSDYADDRGFHVFDTETCEMEYIRNPYRMFHKVNYDDSTLTDNFQKRKLVSKFDAACDKFTGCYVRVVVAKKTDPMLFEEFLEKLFKANPADVNIMDNFQEYLAEEDVDTNIMAQDTLSILNSSVDSVNLEEQEKLDLKKLMTALYTEAIALGVEIG